MHNVTLKPGPGAPHRREAWVHRFAIAAFMADQTLLWEEATEAGETLWSDFGALPPEDVAESQHAKL